MMIFVGTEFEAFAKMPNSSFDKVPVSQSEFTISIF